MNREVIRTRLSLSESSETVGPLDHGSLQSRANLTSRYNKPQASLWGLVKRGRLPANPHLVYQVGEEVGSRPAPPIQGLSIIRQAIPQSAGARDVGCEVLFLLKGRNLCVLGKQRMQLLGESICQV